MFLALEVCVRTGICELPFIIESYNMKLFVIGIGQEELIIISFLQKTPTYASVSTILFDRTMSACYD